MGRDRRRASAVAAVFTHDGGERRVRPRDNPTPPAPQKMGITIRIIPERSSTPARSGCSTTARLRSGATPTRRSSSSRGNTRLHYHAYPVGRAEGQARFARDPEFQITTKGADHPFHIHVNPCWVTRIDVPDEQGRLHNMLSAPEWMDTVSIPRGGRVVFRSRFADYVGHVGEPLPHPDARGSRDDAGGGVGAAR